SRQIGRDALPRLSVIARAKQKLRADVNRSVLRRAHLNRRVPVVAQLAFLVIGQWLNAARLVRLAIDAADVAALRFGIDVIGIGRICKYPESVAAIDVFPTVVGDSSRIG